MSGDTRTIDIKMPQLAESVVNATISKWLIKPGEPVDEYEPICEVITDKVTAELPSTEAGTMGEILVEEGQTVDVGAVICTMQIVAGDDSFTAAPATPASRESSRREQRSQTVNVDENAGKQPMSRRYSPAVRTLAEEHEVELSDIQGTGLGGRVTRKDVLAYIEQAKQAPQQMRQNVESTPV